MHQKHKCPIQWMINLVYLLAKGVEAEEGPIPGAPEDSSLLVSFNTRCCDNLEWTGIAKSIYYCYLMLLILNVYIYYCLFCFDCRSGNCLNAYPTTRK